MSLCLGCSYLKKMCYLISRGEDSGENFKDIKWFSPREAWMRMYFHHTRIALLRCLNKNASFVAFTEFNLGELGGIPLKSR